MGSSSAWFKKEKVVALNRERAAAVLSGAWLMALPVLLCATSADAQEKGQVGIAMGYPTSVGVVWHVADRVAIRPELSVSQASTTITTTTTLTVPFGGPIQTIVTQSTSDATTVAGGVSGLFYLWKREGLGAYLTPRYSYGRVTSTSSSGSRPEAETANTNHFVSGSFGAQYALGRRFAVFGEVGLAYSRTNQEPSSADSSAPSPPVSSRTVASTHTFGIRSGAGVVLYFR